MHFLTFRCAAALAVAVLTTAAHAADCPAFSEKNVSVTGSVVEHKKPAGMLKLETAECGKITVGIPATTKGELALYYQECPVGVMALAEGEMIIGILEAKVLGCY